MSKGIRTIVRGRGLATQDKINMRSLLLLLVLIFINPLHVGLKKKTVSLNWCIFDKKLLHEKGFPSGSDSKENTCNARDSGLIPGWGRSPVRGHGNPLQYSCLENPMDRGAWWATVHGVAKSQTQLSD